MQTVTLIIDKRRELSVKYKKLLANQYSQVIISKNLLSAMKTIQDKEPDLIIISDSIDSDLSDYCKKIRALTYNMRPIIIAMSKSAELDDRIKVLDSGADDFMSEPVNSEEFVMRIKAHLRREFESNLDYKKMLPNKNYSMRALKRMLTSNRQWACLYVTVENFNNYSESYTRLASDKLLQTYAAIISSALNENDYLGALAENEFLIISDLYKAEKIANFLTFAFDTVMQKFYSPQDLKRGYIILHGDEQAGRRCDFMHTTIGIVTNEFKEYNDIIHEITVRPGELHTLANVGELKVDEGEVVKKGTVIAEGIKASETSIITIMDSGADDLDIDDLDEELDTSLSLDEDSISNQPIQILVRPVQVLNVEQKNVSIKFNTTDDLIDIVPVTQLQYKDGARVRNLDGSTITRTSLVLQMQGYLSHLKGMVELDEQNNLRIVVLENLIIRREQEGNAKAATVLQTELLVKDGQTIDPKTPIAKTQVLAVNDGVASIKNDSEDARRLLLTSETYETVMKIASKPVVKKGDFVKLDGVLSESGDKSTVSGQVISVNKGEVTVRAGRPYLISPGTMLQVESGALVLRGDMIATLVFERQKTGDIVQGLPRVEELLEGRKPKDCAILAEEDGVAEIVTDEDLPRLYIVNENGRTEIKYAIDANIIVQDKQKISKGQPLTSGPLNPHDVIRLCGPEAAQQYLVDEVQRVYRSQGVEIADKHVEIIVRQMTKKVKVLDAGDTTLLPGELVEIQHFENENKAVEEKGGTLATCEYMLLGITKASLNTESFISAASFQETTRILTEAAVDGKKDMLRGLKENVIIGRLIPAGTGFHHLTYASEERDKEAQKRAAQRNQARKPAAILEEIEGMFGAPELPASDNASDNE